MHIFSVIKFKKKRKIHLNFLASLRNKPIIILKIISYSDSNRNSLELFNSPGFISIFYQNSNII